MRVQRLALPSTPRHPAFGIRSFQFHEPFNRCLTTPSAHPQTQFLTLTRYFGWVAPALVLGTIDSGPHANINFSNRTQRGNPVILRAGVAVLVLGCSTFAAAFDLPTAWNTREVNLQTNDIVYDMGTGHLFASIPSGAGVGLGNTISEIDPVSGTVLGSTFIGSEPGKLALSKDGSTLYAALDGAAAVRRFDVPSRTAGLQFALGMSDYSGPYFALDLAIAPGNNSALAVARRNECCGLPLSDGVRIYDDGVPRRYGTGYYSSVGQIEFSDDPGRLFGYNDASSGFELYELSASVDGVSAGRSVRSLVTGYQTEILFQDGLLYTTNGRVVDPFNFLLVGTYGLTSESWRVSWTSMAVDSDKELVYFLRSANSAARIDIFDLATFVPVGGVDVPGARGTPGALERIGTDGLAFRTSAGQVLILTPVPEPREWMMLAVGLAVIAGWRRSR